MLQTIKEMSEDVWCGVGGWVCVCVCVCVGERGSSLPLNLFRGHEY